MTNLESGIAAFQAQNYTTALNLLTPIAQQGNDEAQCILGCLYQLGQGVEQDQALATFWYQQAAKQGNGLAANNLAGLIWMGYESMAPNRLEAAKWYEIARAQGFRHAPTGV